MTTRDEFIDRAAQYRRVLAKLERCQHLGPLGCGKLHLKVYVPRLSDIHARIN